MRCADDAHVTGSGLRQSSRPAFHLDTVLFLRFDLDSGCFRRLATSTVLLPGMKLVLDGLLVSQISWEISKIERGDHLQYPTRYTPAPGSLYGRRGD